MSTMTLTAPNDKMSDMSNLASALFRAIIRRGVCERHPNDMQIDDTHYNRRCEAQDAAARAMALLRLGSVEPSNCATVIAALSATAQCLSTAQVSLRQEVFGLIETLSTVCNASIPPPQALRLFKAFAQQFLGPAVDACLASPLESALFWSAFQVTSAPPPRCALQACESRCARQLQVHYMAWQPDACSLALRSPVIQVDCRLLSNIIAARQCRISLSMSNSVAIIGTPANFIPFNQRLLEMLVGAGDDVFNVLGQCHLLPVWRSLTDQIQQT
jgi:hypothetical protein